jgi:hypothetical protein
MWRMRVPVEELIAMEAQIGHEVWVGAILAASCGAPDVVPAWTPWTPIIAAIGEGAFGDVTFIMEDITRDHWCMVRDAI